MPELLKIPMHVVPEEWVASPSGELAYLLDPATRKRLNVAMPHGWLQADQRLSGGYAALGRLGSALRVDVLLTRHREGSDLGDPRTFEQRVAAHDMYALEQVGWKAKSHERILKRLEAYKPVSFQTPVSEREYRTAARLGKHAVVCDVEQTLTRLDQMLLRFTRAAYKASRPVDAPDDKEVLAVQHMREWYMVGRLGMALQARSDVRSVLWPVGALHFDLVRKLQTFRVQAEPLHNVQLPEETYRRIDRLYRTGTFLW